MTSYVRHGVLTKKDVFRWNIEASLALRGEARSDAFTFGPAANSRFCLMLAPDPDKSEYLLNQFGVCLRRTSPAPTGHAEDIAVKVSFALLDTRDRLHYACEKVMRGDTDRVYATFDNSVFDKHRQIFLRKGLLSIHCALDVGEVLTEDGDEPTGIGRRTTSKRAPGQANEDGADDLATDLSSLLDNAKFCDVTLCAGGREFRAHRAILAARSPVFAAMFEHDTLEKAEDRVDIEDLDGDVLHQLLRYVYSGSTAPDAEDEAGSSSSVILSLLAAADKYSLPKLKEACSGHLRSNLTADMALGVLAVADLHEDEDLKEAAVRTVLDNAVRIMKTDDWLAFLKDYSELANCVILRLAMQHK